MSQHYLVNWCHINTHNTEHFQQDFHLVLSVISKAVIKMPFHGIHVHGHFSQYQLVHHLQDTRLCHINHWGHDKLFHVTLMEYQFWVTCNALVVPSELLLYTWFFHIITFWYEKQMMEQLLCAITMLTKHKNEGFCVTWSCAFRI